MSLKKTGSANAIPLEHTQLISWWTLTWALRAAVTVCVCTMHSDEILSGQERCWSSPCIGGHQRYYFPLTSTWLLVLPWLDSGYCYLLGGFDRRFSLSLFPLFLCNSDFQINEIFENGKYEQFHLEYLSWVLIVATKRKPLELIMCVCLYQKEQWNVFLFTYQWWYFLQHCLVREVH